jgi:hypothetical protein
VNINPDYIALCRKRMSGTFSVGDGTNLEFPDASFDEVVSIAPSRR